MDGEFIKYLASLGVGGILAAIMYYQNRKDSDLFASQIKNLYESEKGRTDILVNLVTNTVTAITKNTAVCESLHIRLDRENGEERK